MKQRRDAGIAAPGENEEGYLFANDLNTPRRFEKLADMLSARGHGDARIEKILGKNLVRVFTETWNLNTDEGTAPLHMEDGRRHPLIGGPSHSYSPY